MKGLFWTLVAAVGWTGLPCLYPAVAAPTAHRSSEVDRAVRQALFSASMTEAAIQRQMDERLVRQSHDINALRGRVATLRRSLGSERNVRQRIQAQLGALEWRLSEEQARLLSELEARDHEFAREIAILRGAVEDIASTPEALLALERYNEGDTLQALAQLDALRSANERSRSRRTAWENAAEARRVAALALARKGEPGATIELLIRRFEQIIGFDPTEPIDHIELAKLYHESGRLVEAQRAAETAVRLANSDELLANALMELATIHDDRSDARAATNTFERAIVVLRRMAARNPSVRTRANIASGLMRIGARLMADNDMARAESFMVEAFPICDALAAESPRDTPSRLIIALCLGNRGFLGQIRNDLSTALTFLGRAEEELRALHAQDPQSIPILTIYSMATAARAGVHLRAGDVQAALRGMTTTVENRRRILRLDPGVNAYLRLSQGLQELAEVQLELGERAVAERNLDEAVRVARAGVAVGQYAQDPREELSSALLELAQFRASRGNLSSAKTLAREAVDIDRDIVARRGRATFGVLEALLTYSTILHFNAEPTEARAALREMGEAYRQLSHDSSALYEYYFRFALEAHAGRLEQEREQGNLQAARTSFEAALALSRQAMREHEYAGPLANAELYVTIALADVLVRLGRIDEADAHLAPARQRLAGISLADANLELVEAVAELSLVEGDLQRRRGSMAAATTRYGMALTAVRELVRRDPGSAAAHYHLLETLWRLAETERTEPARGRFRSQLATMRRQGTLRPVQERRLVVAGQGVLVGGN